MVDYVKLAATAERLINKNGRDVTILKKDRTPADATKPWRAGGTNNVTVGPLKAVIIPYEFDDEDGSLVRRGDMRAFVAANDTDPQTIEQFDQLIDGSDYWRIEDVEVLKPGDVRLLYDIQLRG